MRCYRLVYFYNIPEHGLPQNGQYYFNILVICIAIKPDWRLEIFGNSQINDVWYLDNITSVRPYVYHFYIEQELINDKDNVDFYIEAYPHCVVEIRDDYNICFYEMIDFDTDDLWEIDNYYIEEEEDGEIDSN